MDPDDKERSERYDFSGPPTSSYILVLTIIALLGWAAYNYYASITGGPHDKRVTDELVLIEQDNLGPDVTNIVDKEFVDESVIRTGLPDGFAYNSTYLLKIWDGSQFLQVVYNHVDGSSFILLRSIKIKSENAEDCISANFPPFITDEDGKIGGIDNRDISAFIWVNEGRIIVVVSPLAVSSTQRNELIALKDFFVKRFPPTINLNR